mmetsp:Transcript_32923/g.37733  ORF Transcript_32923/g.37733 Transcript_32923/m.37733 type:complete len:113 (+) Transcript_32923:1006-1344(+)
MSCGDYDAKALRREAEHKGLFVANYLKQWINIKKVFPLHLYKEETKDKEPAVIKDMSEMLEVLGLAKVTSPSSSFETAFSTARCVVKLLEDEFVFDASHITCLNYSTSDEAA